MKSFCFTLLFALLFGSVVRADDAERLGIKCPVKSRVFAKYIDGEKFVKNCNPGTLDRCDLLLKGFTVILTQRTVSVHCLCENLVIRQHVGYSECIPQVISIFSVPCEN